jgi:hypothetical protein
MDLTSGYAGYGGQFTFTSNGDERMRISSAGNVGINEINPDEKLVVNTSSTGISKFVTAYSFQQRNAAIEIAPAAPNVGNGSGYIAQGLAGGGIGLYQGGTYYGGGNYKLYGNATSISSVQLEQGSIVFQASDGYSTGASPGNTERMRIDASGNVGINEDAPTRQMHIKSPGTGDSRNLLVDTTGANGNAGIGFASGGNEEWALATIGTTGAQDLRLYNWNNTEEVLRVSDIGNVGIGTDVPTYKLVVSDNGTGGTEFQPSATSGRMFTYNRSTNQYIDNLQGGKNIIFQTGTTTNTERMRIDAAGDVMMQGSLEVNGSSFVHDTPNGRITLDRDVGINRLMSTTTGFAAYQTLETRASNFTWRLGTAAPAMTLNSTGSLLVGKDTANYILQGVEINPTGSGVFTTATETPLVTNRNGAGECAAFYLDDVKKGFITQPATGAPTFAAASDERLKDNVVDHESELANVMALRPTRWDWKDGSGAGEGFIAQEVEQTGWADLVGEDVDTGFKNLAGLGAVETRLIKAMQEQQAMIEALKAKVEALENA